MNITKELILSVGQNAAAIKNGADLYKKKSFSHLSVNEEKNLIYGECLGSGRTPYSCSADFLDEAAPVYRCTCPSRQIPCKHVLGLLTAYVEGATFTIGAVPEEILQKRENKEKRAKVKEEKALEKAEAPTKDKEQKPKTAAWKKSAVKKIESQLNGLAEAEKLILNIVLTGAAGVDAKAVKDFSQIIKQLDSYFISGIQNELYALLELLHSEGTEAHAMIADKICELSSLITKSIQYLEEKKENPEKMDTESEIEERIGYPWKLEELGQYGLLEENVQLVQLAFHVLKEEDKKQFVDEGFYISLSSGKIYKTRNYRPFKALKHIKEEDSCSSLLEVRELFIYPSLSLNPRVRWNTVSFSPLADQQLEQILAFAQSNFPEVIKTVKNQLKNLILGRNPVVLLRFKELKKCKDQALEFALLDESGNSILLKDSGYFSESFLYLMNSLTAEETRDQAMLLLFHMDIESGVLSAHPMAFVTRDRIIKFTY